MSSIGSPDAVNPMILIPVLNRTRWFFLQSEKGEDKQCDIHAIMGRLSLLGRREGSMLHEIIAEGVSAHLYTLSGRVQFPVLRASSVGVPHGRDISSRMFTMRSRRWLRSLPVLVRWALAVPSQVV